MSQAKNNANIETIKSLLYIKITILQSEFKKSGIAFKNTRYDDIFARLVQFEHHISSYEEYVKLDEEVSTLLGFFAK